MKKEIEKLFYFPRIQQYSHPSGTVGKEKKKKVPSTRNQRAALSKAGNLGRYYPNYLES